MTIVAHETRRDLVRAAGPDTVTFLQGQLSQDLTPLAVGEATWSLLLQPSGKIEAWVRVHRTAEEEVVLDVEPGGADVVVARLTRFLLRTRCTVTAEPGVGCVAVRGGPAPSGSLPIVWPGTDGGDLLGPDATVPAGATAIDAEAFAALRIRHGVPTLGAELTERTIPAEAGAWFIERSVSFTKGCYTGQELVARIDSRGGNVPRLLRGLRFDGGPAAVGDDVRVDDGVVGTVTSAAVSAEGEALGLAYIKRGVEAPAKVDVGPDSARAELVPLPMP